MSVMLPIRVPRGRAGLASKKKLVPIRQSLGAIDYFRDSGAGCQSRIDAEPYSPIAYGRV